MKKRGSKSTHEHQRNSDLMRAYRNEVAKAGNVYLPDLLRRVVNSPSVRFWVSSERAAIIIARMDKGDPLAEMGPLKREMYGEIYRRVQEMRGMYPDMPLSHLAEIVVLTPAPKFYLTPGSAKIIIHKIRKKKKG